MKVKKFKGKILVSDMDCTMLNSKYLISKENIDAIHYFVEKGGLFTIATGRTEMALKTYIDLLPINLPVIVSNGAKIYDSYKKEFITQKGFNSDNIDKILNILMDQFPNTGIEISNTSKLYFLRENKYTDYHKNRESFLYAHANMNSVSKPWYNIYLLDDPKKIDEIEDFISATNILEDWGTSVRTEAQFLCIYPANISKWSAVSDLINLYNLHEYEIFAVGDNMNDKELIKFADIGFAVLNANPKLKKHADFICHDNNNSALANVVNIINELIKYSFIGRVS